MSFGRVPLDSWMVLDERGTGWVACLVVSLGVMHERGVHNLRIIARLLVDGLIGIGGVDALTDA